MRNMLILVGSVIALAVGLPASVASGTRHAPPAWAGNPRLDEAGDFAARVLGGQATSSGPQQNGSSCAAEASTTGNVQVNCRAEDDGSPQNTESETSVAAFGQKVVLGFNDSLVCCRPALNLTGYSVSTDGGTSFTDMGDLPAAPGVLPIGDPSVAHDDLGNFYATTLALKSNGLATHSEIAFYKMPAGSNTFQLVSVAVDVGSGERFFGDKEYVAVGRDGGGNVHFYISWTLFSRAPSSPIMLTDSTDGAHWRTTMVSATDACAQGSTPLPAGGKVFVSWEQQTPAACASPVGTASIEMMATFDVASGTVDRTTPVASVKGSGDQIVACNSARDLRQVIETEPGHDVRNFEIPAMSTPQAISPTPSTANMNDRFQPWLAADAGGLHAMWYERVKGTTVDQIRTDKEDLTLATALSSPVPGAESAISSVTFPVVQTNPNQDPVISNCYMGDYNNIVSDGGARYVTWGDNRNVVTTSTGVTENQPDVFLAKY